MDKEDNQKERLNYQEEDNANWEENNTYQEKIKTTEKKLSLTGKELKFTAKKYKSMIDISVEHRKIMSTGRGGRQGLLGEK